MESFETHFNSLVASGASQPHEMRNALVLKKEQDSYVLQSVTKPGLPPSSPDIRLLLSLFMRRIGQLEDGSLELARNLDILETAADLGVLVGSRGEFIGLSEGTGRVQLNMQLKDLAGLWKSTVEIVDTSGEVHEILHALAPGFVLCENGLHRIKRFPGHRTLEAFSWEFEEAHLQDVVSMFCHYTQGTDVVSPDLTVRIGNQRPVHMLLHFDNIDRAGSLHLHTGFTCEGLDHHFINRFHPSYGAMFDDSSLQLEIFHLEYGASLEVISKNLEKLMGSHARKERITTGFYCTGNRFILEREFALSFLTGELGELVSGFTLSGADHLESFDISFRKLPLHMAVHGGERGYLEGQVGTEVDNEPMSMERFFELYDEYGYIPSDEGKKIIVPEEWIRRVRILLGRSKKSAIKLSVFDIPGIEDLLDEEIVNESVQEFRDALRGLQNLSEYAPPVPDIHATLRPYQKEGYSWLHYLYAQKIGCCLADDMGLGKTIQTIALLSSVLPKEKEPALIIMPKSLLYTWYSEFSKFAPQFKVAIYHGSSRLLDEVMQHDVILSTYHTARNDIETLQEQHFSCVVLDESQHIKNIQSNISKAVLKLKTDHRLALSGTPIENNIFEVYALFRFIVPGMFGSFASFRYRFGDPVMLEHDKDALKAVQRMITPFLLRRVKDDVLKDLPPRSEQVLYVQMSPRHRSLYEERRKFFQKAITNQIIEEGLAPSRLSILQAFSELRQIASVPEEYSDRKVVSPKVELLMESLAEAVENGHKALVFAQYLSAVSLIEEALDGLGISYGTISGATHNRQAVIDDFQQRDRFQVLVLTLKTGGVGLTLTKADYVFIYDPWWNTAAEQQAIDRTHRIGQERPVFSYKLIVKDTIEEKILQLQQEKKELIDSLITSDGSALKQLDAVDVEYILSGGDQ